MARLMSSTELKERIDQDEPFVLVDVTDPDSFREEHIPGATNIPMAELGEKALTALTKNQRIIVYAKDHDDVASTNAAELLENLGYRKVSDFDGGIFAWKRAGFLTEGDQAEILG